MGVYSNGVGQYRCNNCGNTWRARDRYAWWPIRLRLSSVNRAKISMHGVQVGWEGAAQRLFTRVVRLGPLLIIFGPHTSPDAPQVKPDPRLPACQRGLRCEPTSGAA